MKNSDKTLLREKSPADLRTLANQLREKMLKARLKRSVEGQGIGMTYRSLRRQIARIETLIHEKALQGTAP